MDKLMELLEEGRAWSVKDLADSLQKPQEEVQKQVESLEYDGYLRKTCGCGPQCKGCGPVSYTHLDVYKRQVQT